MLQGPLIDVDTLHARLGDPRLRILDCRHKLTDPTWGPHQYRENHLPGAVHAHIDHDLSGPPGPTTGRHPLPEPDTFRQTVSRWGIDQTKDVVVYDDAGGIWAARAWWLLRDYGHESVALLDGGLVAWNQARLPLTQDIPTPPRTLFKGQPGHMPRVEARDLLQGLKTRSHTLLDARAPERYRGETEPIDPVAGHIPNAQNLPATSLLSPETRLLPRHQLRQRFDTLAPPGAPTPVAYCGSGVTGCHLVLAADAAGRGRIALYPGSWSEWIRDASRPIARGSDLEPKAR